MTLRHPIARRTIYRGIPMRSRLESRAARYLDHLPGAAWEYEPEVYADETGDILPDFCVRLADRILFVEVKGYLDDEARQTTRRALSRIFSSLPKAAYAIWTGAVIEEGTPFEIERADQPPVSRVLRTCAVCGRSLILDLSWADTLTVTCARCELTM